jgi:Uncharacterized protein involved in propionate catabolism
MSNMMQTYDKEIESIANYVVNFKIDSNEAFNTARNCLIDTLGCGLEALDYPACIKLLGPTVPGTSYQMEQNTWYRYQLDQSTRFILAL